MVAVILFILGGTLAAVDLFRPGILPASVAAIAAGLAVQAHGAH